jgi:hypothetical protein
LTLETLVCIDGIAEVFLKAIAYLFLNVVADDQERNACEPGRNCQERKKELRAQPKPFQAGLLPTGVGKAARRQSPLDEPSILTFLAWQTMIL